jgi:putative redox protein
MIHAWSDGPNYVTRFSDGTHQSVSDTTPDKGGSGGGFRPHDLLAAALACCVNMTVRMAAGNLDIPLESVTTRVNLNRDGSDQVVFQYEIELHGQLTEEQRAKLFRAAGACPVRKSLSKTLIFDNIRLSENERR